MRLMTEHTGHSLFDEAYWLDAVAPGQWHAVEIHRDGILMGRLPYVIKKRFGFNAISTPLYSNWLGPWIRPSGGKPTTELSHQHQILEELAKGLPKADRTYIAAAPEFTNLMALHWAGFQLSFGYTHRLDVGAASVEQLWDGLRDTVRRQIRKAQKLTHVTATRSVADFSKILIKTFARQGKDVSGSVPTLERIDAVMGPRNQRKIYCAEDQEGNIHAAVYVVYDERHVFYIAGGGDPAFRQSGAHSLAMWTAILDAREKASIFDFVGSMVPGIEYFVRGFGATQTPRMMAEKYSTVGRVALALRTIRG
jgi:Acetyltransferase (GNAT) domain